MGYDIKRRAFKHCCCGCCSKALKALQQQQLQQRRINIELYDVKECQQRLRLQQLLAKKRLSYSKYASSLGVCLWMLAKLLLLVSCVLAIEEEG